MLAYDEVGQGEPLVLLHAGIADRTMWSEHLEPLAAAGYRVLALDLPGFGETPIQSGEQAPWQDALAAMDQLGLEQMVLAGNSFGGAVALRMAALAPERVTALALVSAPGPRMEPSPQLEAAWEAEERALQRGDNEAAIQTVIETWTLPDAPAELRDRIATMQRRAYELQAGAGEVREASDPVEENSDLLRSVDMPALVAVGERDMPDFRAAAEAMARALPRARLEVMEGAGHLAPLETPERFRDSLLAFLGSVSQLR